MKRLAQTMSQPSRASATMRSSIAALVSSSAGYIMTNGERLAANPVITAPCAPRPALRTNSDRQRLGIGADRRQRVVVVVVVADQHPRRRRDVFRQRRQRRHDVAALVVDRDDDVELGLHLRPRANWAEDSGAAIVPSPLAGEGSADVVNAFGWVRGKSHPSPILCCRTLRLPSPARGEGAITTTALVAHHGFSPAVSTKGRSGSMIDSPKIVASMKL